MKQKKQKYSSQRHAAKPKQSKPQSHNGHNAKTTTHTIDPTLPFPAQTEMTVTSQLGVPLFPQSYTINYVDHKVAGRIRISTFWLTRLFHIFLSNTWLPFSITLTTNDRKKIGVIHKPWNPWGNEINIYDEKKQLLGNLRQASTFTQQRFELYNTEGKKIAEFLGVQKGAVFEIHAVNTAHVGTISIIKSNLIAVAISAQRRSRIILPPLPEAHKRCIIIAAMTLPVITKELLS
ncbi:MAG: hypothetical protein QY314_03815 [Candidatus Dojkabacteria bacterium]|nr:MAG: hypothetical protein QY314_03815 [Candidatus Dojkabacteria bacterium]